MLLLIGLILIPVRIFADEEEEDNEIRVLERGQLLINDQTIQDRHGGDHDQFLPIGFEIAPFLFLEEMMEAEAQRVARNTEFLITTRENLFLVEASTNRFDTSEIVDRLFIGEDISEPARVHVNAGFQASYFHIPVWIIVIGAVVVTSILAYVAAIIGSVIHKNKEGEKS